MSTNQLFKVARKYSTKLLLKKAEENDFYWDNKDEFRKVYNKLEEDLYALKLRGLSHHPTFSTINHVRAELLSLFKKVDEDNPIDGLKNLFHWVTQNGQLIEETQDSLIKELHYQKDHIAKHAPLGLPLLIKWLRAFYDNLYEQDLNYRNKRTQMENSTIRPPHEQSSIQTEIVDLPKPDKLPEFG